MSNCANCETTNDIDARFCKCCGKAIKGTLERTGRGFSIDGQSFAGQAALKALKRIKLMNQLFIVGFGLVMVFLLMGSKEGGFLGGIFVFAITVFLGIFFGRIRRGEYSALPGARDRDGNHRCVTRGRRGIWRRTVYKTNTTIAACSNCKADLWYE